MVFWIVSQCCSLKFQNPMLCFNIQTWVCYNSRIVLSNIVFIYIPAWILQITLLGSHITNVVLSYPRSYLYIFQGWSFKNYIIGISDNQCSVMLSKIVFTYIPRLNWIVFTYIPGWILPNYIIGISNNQCSVVLSKIVFIYIPSSNFPFYIIGITNNQCIVVLAKVVFICIPSLDF